MNNIMLKAKCGTKTVLNAQIEYRIIFFLKKKPKLIMNSDVCKFFSKK